jgi:hypothetical protein
MEENQIIYSITMYIKVSSKDKYTYVKTSFDDCKNLIDKDFFNRIKEYAIIGIKQEYEMDGDLIAEFVEELEYKSFNAKNSVNYNITENDVVRVGKSR